MRQRRDAPIIQPEHLVGTSQKIHIERLLAQCQSRSLNSRNEQSVFDRTGCDEPMPPHGAPSKRNSNREAGISYGTLSGANQTV